MDVVLKLRTSLTVNGFFFVLFLDIYRDSIHARQEKPCIQTKEMSGYAMKSRLTERCSRPAAPPAELGPRPHINILRSAIEVNKQWRKVCRSNTAPVAAIVARSATKPPLTSPRAQFVVTVQSAKRPEHGSRLPVGRTSVSLRGKMP